jgi:hypothetical protein
MCCYRFWKYMSFSCLQTSFQLHVLYSVERDGKMVLIGEWVRMWKEIVTYLKTLYCDSRGDTDKNHENLSHVS